MIDAEIERNEATIEAILSAFSGSSYIVRCVGYAGVYTISCPRAWPVQLTQEWIVQRGVDALVDEIIADWDRA